MSLNPCCIETGVYVSAAAIADVVSAAEAYGYTGVLIGVRTIAQNRITSAGTIPYGGRREMSHGMVRCAPVYLCGIPSLIVYSADRIIWYGAAGLVTRRGFTDAALNAWREELFKNLKTKEVTMNYETNPYPAPTAPYMPRPPARAGQSLGQANYTPADQLEMAKAAVAAAEQAVQAAAEAEHTAAVKAARDAELKHADTIARLQTELVAEVKRIEAGHFPAFSTSWLQYRKELAAYAESLGYKFVVAGTGGHVALCKRGAR